MRACVACSTSWQTNLEPSCLGRRSHRQLRRPTAAPQRCLLYVGGRCSLVPHLRRHAEARHVELLHHDGGDEEGMHVLERLIGRADAVFCPIDCVSHQACLAAKQLCRRLDKTFVPLRTGSGTCFLRAVDRWRGAQ